MDSVGPILVEICCSSQSLNSDAVTPREANHNNKRNFMNFCCLFVPLVASCRGYQGLSKTPRTASNGPKMMEIQLSSHSVAALHKQDEQRRSLAQAGRTTTTTNNNSSCLIVRAVLLIR
jgi:hypothetical protein